MPYFSFSIKQNFLKEKSTPKNFEEILANTTYFSKNTYLWKKLNLKTNKRYINFVNFENRIKTNIRKGSILFCLPPSIGLGDAIEYGLAIDSISRKKKFSLSAVAFAGRYKNIFTKYFKIKEVYGNFIPLNKMEKFDMIFHITLEILKLKYQKYNRTDIEDVLTKHFNVNKKKITKKVFRNKIKKINIFPISQSPVRSMSPYLIRKIFDFYNQDYDINIILDKTSEISNYIENQINLKESYKLFPSNLENLCKIIKDTEFGIFIDSGPLHLAKLFYIKGVLISTTVSGKILLNRFKNIKEIKNNYYSKYCSAPCGLTNLINLNNRVGCYDSLKIPKKNFITFNKLNPLQRGSIKNKYIDYMINPVSCIREINAYKMIKKINEYLCK